MKPKQFMLIAGETSGDLLAAELVRALKRSFAIAPSVPVPHQQPLTASLTPRFFGAGGPKLAAAGVDLTLDLTPHAVVGLTDVLRNYRTFRAIFNQLLALALRQEPDAIILVDYSGFNLRFAQAIRDRLRRARGTFWNWNPLVVYYVSPQVWASRARRARKMENNVDLLLSIFPFEKDWYSRHAPKLRVEFVGHPILDRYGPPGLWMETGAAEPDANETPSLARWTGEGGRTLGEGESTAPSNPTNLNATPSILLLPGSRAFELERHLPVMIESARRLEEQHPANWTLILPSEDLKRLAEPHLAGLPNLHVQIGGLADSLRAADLAIASTGTVTLECAYFGVPTVAIYKTSRLTYEIGKRLVTVPYLAMPNLLAEEQVFPEFIQDAAIPENIVPAALDLLTNTRRRAGVQSKLANVIRSLGTPGAAQRAAETILQALHRPDSLAASLRGG